MYKMYLKEIDLEKHKEKMAEIIEMLMCNVKEHKYDLYEHIEGELYEMAYGMKINEEMAKKWVKNMKPVGEHWSMEETTQAMHNLGYSHNEIDFYVVANMMINDYHNLTKEDEMLALKLAHDWLDDEDARECKLYNYWKYISVK